MSLQVIHTGQALCPPSGTSSVPITPILNAVLAAVAAVLCIVVVSVGKYLDLPAFGSLREGVRLRSMDNTNWTLYFSLVAFRHVLEFAHVFHDLGDVLDRYAVLACLMVQVSPLGPCSMKGKTPGLSFRTQIFVGEGQPEATNHQPLTANRQPLTAANRRPLFTVSVVLCLAHVLTMKQLALRTSPPPPPFRTALEDMRQLLVAACDALPCGKDLRNCVIRCRAPMPPHPHPVGAMSTPRGCERAAGPCMLTSSGLVFCVPLVRFTCEPSYEVVVMKNSKQNQNSGTGATRGPIGGSSG